MAAPSLKYIAGFLDADGSIQVMWRPLDRANSNPEVKRAYVALEFSQETAQDEVLHRIQDVIGGKIYPAKKNNRYSVLKVWGKEAEMCINRMRKHVVIKRHYLDVVMDMHKNPHNVTEAKKRLKEERKVKSLPLPNFPARGWLAGYFDGDGTISIRIGSGRTAAQPTIEIVADAFDSEGLEVLHKNFGGSLRRTKDRSHLMKWTMTMPPSKAKQFLGYFSKHLIKKKDQADFILGCAAMGHYRDGKNIKEALRQLKAHPHRLSEPKIDAGALLSGVRDIRTEREMYHVEWKQNGNRCACGSTKYYCYAMCKKCYDRKR